MKKLVFVFVLAILLVSACAPSARDVAEEVIAIQAESTQTALASEAHCTNSDGGIYTVGAHEWFMGKEYVCTADGLGNAAFLPVQGDVQTPTPTGAPAISNGPTATPNSYPWECYFAGARMTDDKIPGAERIGGSGKCDINALINGVSLQPYWEEVVTYDTLLPAGLDRNDVATASFEPINDFLRVIGIRHGSVMYYFVLDADESADNFAFWWTSCIKYDVDTMTLTVYKNDSGQPGGFDGSCTGTWKEFGALTSDRFSGEILTYINAINELAAKGWVAPSKPLVLDTVWFEAWPPQ